MFVSINQDIIELNKYDNFEEMYNFLESCDIKASIEKNSEQKNEFYALAISLNQSTFIAPSELTRKKFGVEIGACENTPTILPIPEKRLILLGLDREVVGISLEDKSIMFNISLMNLPFHGFFLNLEENLILIFFELGIVAIDYEGKEVWGYDRDVLCESIIDRNKLILELLDLGTVVINIKDGKLLDSTGNL